MNFKQILLYVVSIVYLSTLIGCSPTLRSENLMPHARANNNNVIDNIVCKEVTIVNDEGKTILTLGNTGGHGSILVNDKEGKRIVGVGNLGGGFMVMNGDGDGTLFIRTNNNIPSIEFLNNIGTSIYIGGTDKDNSMVAVYSKTGDLIANISSTEEGGLFSLYNNIGNIVAGLAAVSNGNGGLVIFDKEENTLATIETSKDGGGVLSLFNKSNTKTPVIELSTTDTVPDINLDASSGTKLYLPTRLEWLALDLNAGVPLPNVKYYTTTKLNTIIVSVFYSSTTTLKERQNLMRLAKKAIRDEANARNWNWLILEEQYIEY